MDGTNAEVLTKTLNVRSSADDAKESETAICLFVTPSTAYPEPIRASFPQRNVLLGKLTPPGYRVI